MDWKQIAGFCLFPMIGKCNNKILIKFWWSCQWDEDTRFDGI